MKKFNKADKVKDWENIKFNHFADNDKQEIVHEKDESRRYSK